MQFFCAPSQILDGRPLFEQHPSSLGVSCDRAGDGRELAFDLILANRERSQAEKRHRKEPLTIDTCKTLPAQWSSLAASLVFEGFKV